MTRTLVAVLVVMIGSGCMPPSARTHVGASILGWDFTDTKDNDIDIEGAEYDPSTHKATLKSFKMRNNASDVNKTLTGMMMAYAEQQRAANEGIQQMMIGLNGLMGQAASIVRGSSIDVKGPNGIDGTFKTGDTAPPQFNPVPIRDKHDALPPLDKPAKPKAGATSQPTVPQTMNIRKPDGNARGLYENDCVAYAVR